MKTKYLITIVLLCLIIPFNALSQNVDIEELDTTTTVNSSIDTSQVMPKRQHDTLLFNLLKSDSLPSEKGDSIQPKVKRREVLTAKVETSADDSTIFSVDRKKVFLFGNAQINYEDIVLTADYIEIDMDQGIMYAEGMDSAGMVRGEPVFQQGGQEMKAKTITYNLKTEKGYIKGLYTEQDEGYLHSSQTKKQPDNSINLKDGKYTTCELEHPHFYLKLTRGKVVPDKAIVAGFSYMVLEDIPLYPLAIPFGFFPSTKERASGFIIPTYGEEKTRGFFLKNGGYYFAVNEHFDLALTGDIYSKGSWQVKAKSAYKVRYKYSGSFNLSYSKVIVGEPGLSDYNESNQYAIKWSHAQDAKAKPNSNFSANVNFQSSGNNRYNETNTTDRLSQQLSSSVSYRKTFAGTPFSVSANLRHNQNLTDSTMSLTLPQLTLTMSRIFPFRRSVTTGGLKWYENIGLSYTANAENKATSMHDSVLWTPQMLDMFNYGIKHTPSLSYSFKLLNYITASPGFSFVDRMYFKRDVRDYSNYDVDSTYSERVETGFYNLYNYSFSLGFATKLYGMYQYKNSRVKAIRHVLTPSVSLSYRPDFSEEHFGFYMQDTAESTGYYNPYAAYDIYGMPGTGKSGSVSFSLANNLEMKVLSAKDTVTGEKKIKLLDALNFSTSYNMIADSLNWSPLTMSARTTLFNSMNITLSGSGDFYAIDSAGTKYNEFYFNTNGQLFRLTRLTASTGFSLNSKNLSGNKQGSDNPDARASSLDRYDGYDYFDLPWNVSINYNFTYTKAKHTPTIVQTATLSGNFSLTDKWKIGFRTGYDLVAKEMSYTSFNLSRDLHCWMASVSIIPFGQYQSYSFSIGIKSGMLSDIKYDKNKSWIDNTY